MIYKLGNVTDLVRLPSVEREVGDILLGYLSVLSEKYGSNRNVDCDDGGYVLYVADGTAPEELRQVFDYTDYPAEWVKLRGELCEALYLLNNEYAVIMVMLAAAAPAEILVQMEGD